MAATKTSSTLRTSTSSAAGTPTTSSTLDLSTAYGAVITAKATPAGTLTTPMTVTVNISPDGTNFYQWAQGTTGLTNAVAYAFAWELPAAAIKANVVFGGNVGAAVQVEAQAQVLATI